MKIRLLSVLFVVLLLSPVVPSRVEARDRDPLAPMFSMEAPPFEAFPPDIVSQENSDAIVALVNEARLFGVPVAVRVVSTIEGHPNLPQLADLEPGAAVPDDVMRDMAKAWMREEPIESSPGAMDGFLMLVIMPEDPTLSSAVIEPGSDALPLNGLTRANIDEVVQTLVLPSFAENQVSQGIRNGLSVFSYNNLFGRPERIELGGLHQDLQMVAGVPLAGLTLVGAAGLAGLAAWIHRRDRVVPHAGEETMLSPFSAAALYRGRVDDAVVTGGLLEMVRQGALIREDDALRIVASRADTSGDPFLTGVLDVLRKNAGPDGTVAAPALRRLHDLMGPARHEMEDTLARPGLFNRDGRVELAWLLLASALVGAIALFTLLPSILGAARFGILAILIAAITISVVLIWATRRSWTTPRGQEALEEWTRAAPVPDKAVFDTIVNQDDLISSVGGPFTPATVNLVRSLRGIGAT